MSGTQLHEPLAEHVLHVQLPTLQLSDGRKPAVQPVAKARHCAGGSSQPRASQLHEHVPGDTQVPLRHLELPAHSPLL